MIPKRIETIKTIEELQMYACSKVRNDKNWAMKCVDCKKCPVGKKAEELLEIETAPEAESSHDEPAELVRGYDSRSEKFLEALKHEDPVKYLLDQGLFGGIRWRAAEALKRWEANHPKDSKTGIRNLSNGIDKSIETRKNKRNGMIRKVLDGADDVAGVLKNALELPGSQRGNAIMSRLYDWSHERWLSEKEHALLAESGRVIGRIAKRNPELTGPDILKILNKEDGAMPEEAAEDEVSIEDFLEEQEPEQTTKDGDFDGDVKTTLPTIKETPVKIGSGCCAAPTNQQIMLEEFSRKRRELTGRLVDLDDQIEELQIEKKTVQESLVSLDNAALLFGMAAKNSVPKD